MTTSEKRLAEVQRLLDVPDKVVLKRASDIAIRPIEWLWRHYLACGVFHVLAGPPGTGKTTLGLAISAALTSAAPWPDGDRAPMGSVVIWSGEDGDADTLVPRLHAMGAGLSRVHLVGAVLTEEGRRPFDPAVDIPLLNRQLESIPDAKLLIIDPIVSAVAGDSHKNAETRRGLQPVVDLARDRGIAVIGITHYTKGTKGRDPLERVTGSLAFGALARIVLGAAKGTDDAPNVFCRVKSNIGPDGGGFEYSITHTDIEPGIVGSRIEWGKPLEGSARDILGACEVESDDAGSEREDAAAWLRAELEDGPIDVKALQKAARDAGHQWHTVKRVKHDIGAEAEKSGFQGGWRWCLPKGADTPKGAHMGNCSLREEKTLKAAPDGASSEGSRSDENCSLGRPREHEGNNAAPFDETRATQGFEADQSPEGSSSPRVGTLREGDPLRDALAAAIHRAGGAISIDHALAYISGWPATDIDGVIADHIMADYVVSQVGGGSKA